MLGPLISAGASLLGGFLNRESSKDANAANAAMAERNIALQREFAQNAIQWKAADAAKAGIHPLYALGAGTTSFSPVSVGATADTSMGSALHSMGQDISRAVAAPMGPATKVAGIQLAQQTASNEADIEYKKLRNTEIRLRIANMAQPGTPPGVDPQENPFSGFQEQTTKPQGMPPITLGGWRIPTDPGTSSAEAGTKRWGEEGPASWATSAAVIDKDLVYNYGPPAQALRWAAQALWNAGITDLRHMRGSAQGVVNRHIRGVIGGN